MSRNGHDKVAATGAELIEKIMKRKNAPDIIIKDEPYVTAGMIKCLASVFVDTRGRMWAEYSNKFVKLRPTTDLPE